MYPHLAVFLLLAVLGGLAGSKARFPGSIAVGAMLFSATGNFLGFGPVEVPPWYKHGLQVLAGCIVGASMTRERVRQARAIIWPVLLNALSLGLAGAGMSFMARRLFGWDLLTAWLAACPGRMADMIIYSGVMGGDTPKVVAAHVLRLVLVLLITPAALRIFGRLFPSATNPGRPVSGEAPLSGSTGPESTPRVLTQAESPCPHYLCLLGLGLAGGFLGQASNLAGGVLLGALVAASLGNLLGLPASRLPRSAGLWLQILAGLLVGVRMSAGEILYIIASLPQLLAIMAVIMAVSIASSLILIRICGWDPATAWLSASPGRMSDMIILAHGLGARTDWVAATHVTRMIMVILATPLILKFA